MQRSVEDIVAPHRQMLSEVVGQTETALNRNTLLEATMDNLLFQAVAEAAGHAHRVFQWLALWRADSRRVRSR